MTAGHPWKHSIADAYANSYGGVAQDFLALVVNPALATLERMALEIDEQPDRELATFRALDHRHLMVKTTMAMCLSIQSLWEQQRSSYLRNCVLYLGLPSTLTKKVEKAIWGRELNCVFKEIRGLDLEKFESYQRLDLLQMLGNVCRHGEGGAANKLREKHPQLWPNWAETSKWPQIPLEFRAPIAGIRIPPVLLRSLVDAVDLFWLDMQIAGLASFDSGDGNVREEIARLTTKRQSLM